MIFLSLVGAIYLTFGQSQKFAGIVQAQFLEQILELMGESQDRSF